MAGNGPPKVVFLSLLLCAAAGCALPISKDLREELSEDITFPMVLQNPTAYAGKIVLWGGEIIDTVNVQDGSDITVLETPLDYWERPESPTDSRGRFIAKSSKFLDPAIYKSGKRITIAGEIVGKESRLLGKIEYVYPVVRVIQLFLWERPHYNGYYYPFWNSPYYFPYGFY